MPTYKALGFKSLHIDENWSVDDLYRDCTKHFIDNLFRDYVEHSGYFEIERIDKLVSNHSNEVTVREDTEILKLSSNRNTFKDHCGGFLPYITKEETRSGYYVKHEEVPFKKFKRLVNKFDKEFLNNTLAFQWPAMTVHVVQIIDRHYSFYTLEY